MATQNFIISVQTRGVGAVNQQINSIGQAARRANSIMGTLRAGLVAFAAIKIGGNILEFADTFTLARNRIGIFTKEASTTTAVLDQLLAIANETRTSFDATATVFSRMTRAAQGTGRSFNDLLGVTTTLNQLVAISGANTQEAQNALIQFSQGLSSGALRGDELRSVVEQLPALAQIIGKEFGIAGGQLASFAKANPGVITTDKILKALAESAKEVESQFKTTAPTFGQAFVVAQNALAKVADDFNRATGLSQLFADAMNVLASNTDVVFKAIVAFGTYLGGRWAVTILTSIRQFGIFNAIFASLPVLIVTAAAALFVFSDQIAAMTTGPDSVQTLGDKFVGLSAVLATAFSGTGIGEFFNRLASGRVTVDDLREAFVRVVDRIVDGFTESMIAIRSFVDLVARLVGLVPEIFDIAFSKAVNLALESLNSLANTIPTILNGIAGTEVVKPITLFDVDAETRNISDIVAVAARESVAFNERLKAERDRSVAAATQDRLLMNAEDSRRANAQRGLLGGAIPGTPPKDLGADDSAKKFESAQKALDNLIKGLNPLAAVNDAINDTNRVLDEAQKRGVPLLMSREEIMQRMIDKALGIENAERKHADVLKALNDATVKANTTDTQRAIILNNANKELFEHNNLVNEALGQYNVEIAAKTKLAQLDFQIQDFRLKGIGTEEQYNELRRQSIREIVGASNATQTYEQEMANLKMALDAAAISQAEFNTLARDAQIKSLSDATDAASGAQKALLELTKGYTDAASQIGGLIQSTFQGLEDNLTSFFTTGKADFKALADSIINDITRIVIKQALLAPLTQMLSGEGSQINGGKGLFGNIAGAFGGGSGGGGFLSGLFGGSGGGFNFGSLLGGFGFADGGSFTVGGRGGHDANPVMMNLTKGEKVTVTPAGGNNDGGMTVVFNIQTQDADSFRQSKTQVLNQFAQALQNARARNG